MKLKRGEEDPLVKRGNGGRVPESDLLQVERVLDDTGGGHSHAEDVLLGGKVIGLCYSVKVGEVTERGF